MKQSNQVAETRPLIGEDRASAEETRRDQSSWLTLWKDTSIRQRLMLGYFLVGDLIVFNCVSFPIPFMPKAVLAKGGTELQSAILLQITPLLMATSSMVFGKYQIYMNSKSLLLSGLSCYVIGEMCFGLLDYSKSVNVLVAGGITIRCLQGIAQGAYFVAELTIICLEYPDHRTQVYGMAQSMLAIGYITGPLIGSILYRSFEGLLQPFVISGGIMAPLVPFGYVLLGSYCAKSDGIRSSQILRVIRKPTAILILGSTCLAEGTGGMSIVLVSVYALSRGLTVVDIGLGVLAAAIAYAVTSSLTGIVASTGRAPRRALLIIGVIGLMAHPAIYTPNQTRAGIFVGLSLFGVTSAITLVGGFGELVYQIAGNGMDSQTDFALHSALSGVWSLAIGTGAFVFPLVGSLMHKFMSLRLVFLCTSGFLMSLVLLVMLGMIAVQHFKSNRSHANSNSASQLIQ